MQRTSERFYFRIEDLAHAQGEYSDLAFEGTSPAQFAAEFQRGLREPDLFRRWRKKQPDPEAVPESLAPFDPDATVVASAADMHTDVEVTTNLTHRVVAHRLTLLVGRGWTLRDVRLV
ncbi:MAG TPA: hypothetical protein VFG73_03050 [Rhodanobacteraceae bacterium]|nr:hypothetical protein [Rhodanobacteraceae bacterium]